MRQAIVLYQQKTPLADLGSLLEPILHRFHQSGHDQAMMVLTEPLPVVPEVEHPAVPDVVRDKIRAGEKCVQEEVRARWPASEQIEREWFSYLARPFRTYPANTIVLMRETNHGIFYIIFPDLKVVMLQDEASEAHFVQILDGEHSLYPIPPKNPLILQKPLAAEAQTYAITSLKPISVTQITFGWSVPVVPTNSNVWWALYSGVMPDWANLKQYVKYDWIYVKNKNYGRTGTQTVEVPMMVSGTIYTFALLNGWNLGDYQQFNAP